MGKISRADWAASVPWSGITGKPSSFGPTDISELTADGYRNGQYPSAVAGRLRATTLVFPPTPTPDPPAPSGGVTKTYVTWDIPSLHALQSAAEDFTIVGAMPGMAIVVGAAFDTTFLTLSAYCYDYDTIRIVATNMSLDDVDPDEQNFQLVFFP